jgi:anti-anti-sigma regulatory factor
VNYQLQTVRSNDAGFEQLGELYQAARVLSKDSLVIDFSQVDFFEANMSAPFGAILSRIASRSNEISCANVPKQIEYILRKNQFLTIYGFPSMEDNHHTTMPYVRFRTTDDRLFEEYVQREFRGKGIPRMSEKLSKIFKKKVFEVFQNAVIHSETRRGVFVCGQYYPQKNRLDITIADAGVGIREKVRRYFDNEKISSVAAIRWALEERHTTKMGPQPGGLGFKFLHEFISLNKGKIKIASRFGFYEYDRGEKTFKKLLADFPGTAVTIEIYTADNAEYCLTSEVTPENVF